MRQVRNVLLTLVSVFILLTVTAIVRAQSSAEQVVDNIKKTSDYVLPYPGILPDNILYNLKVARDKFFEVLIIDPVKKADFYLLQADKRLAAGEALIRNSKFFLGEQTISKAEKYLILAVNQAAFAKGKNKDAREVINRMERAIEKHKEVIASLIKNDSVSIREGLNLSLGLNEKAHNNLDKLL